MKCKKRKRKKGTTFFSDCRPFIYNACPTPPLPPLHDYHCAPSLLCSLHSSFPEAAADVSAAILLLRVESPTYSLRTPANGPTNEKLAPVGNRKFGPITIEDLRFSFHVHDRQIQNCRLRKQKSLF